MLTELSLPEISLRIPFEFTRNPSVEETLRC